MRRSFIALAVLASTALSLDGQQPDESRRAMEMIGPKAIEAHMRFLADDLLEGREAGSRGHEIAARYVAAQFQACGLEPAGRNGSWFQPVPLRKSEIVSAESSVVLRRKGKEIRLKADEDYVLNPSYVDETSVVSAPVVFAGFGVSAPELGYDDYSGIDVRGRIVAYLYGAPASFSTSTRAHYSSSQVKGEAAASRGAVGVLLLRPRGYEERAPWAGLVRQAKKGGMRWLGPKGEPGRVFPSIKASVTLSRAGAESLFEGAATSLDAVLAMETGPARPNSFLLPAEISVRTMNRHTAVESRNVMGLLRGSDPKLSAQTVVYTAHLDHIGITAAVNGDEINNGAFDNASGSAALLEIAKAFSSMPKKPRRSILFVAVTAEEKGLLGSDFFAQFPTVKEDTLVANINMDMFLMLFPFRDSVVLGYENSSLAQQVDAAAREMKLKLTPDPTPEEVSFVRSDQYSFIRTGVPAIAAGEGIDAGSSGKSGSEQVRIWLRTRYHQPSDDLDQPIDFASGARYAQFNFLIGYLVAQQETRPSWNKGDFFGTRFGK